MVPSPELPILTALLTLLACDLGTHAVAHEQPTPFLAAADNPTPAERKAKRTARQAKQAKLDKTSTPAQPKPPTAHPQPTAKQPAAKQPTATQPTATALPTCPPDNALTYRSFGDGFLRTWCVGCHSSTLAASDRQDAPMGVDFDRAALYKPHARDIYDRAVLEAHAAVTDPNGSAAPMPPAGIVPEADRRRLGQWIACGSPGV